MDRQSSVAGRLPSVGMPPEIRCVGIGAWTIPPSQDRQAYLGRRVTIIDARSSTKNKSGGRDPEMTSTKKGNNWYIGMKPYDSVDVNNGVVHTLIAPQRPSVPSIT